MKYTELMKDNIPIASHPEWETLGHDQKDLILKTQVAIEKLIIEPFKELCSEGKECTECKKDPSLPCPLRSIESRLGVAVKFSFLQLLKHGDPTLRTQSIVVFRELFVSSQETISDVKAMKLMAEDLYEAYIKAQPQLWAIKSLFRLLFLYCNWLVTLETGELIEITGHFLAIAKENTVADVETIFELNFLGDHGLCGVFNQLLGFIILCVKGSQQDLALQLWKFDLDVVKSFLTRKSFHKVFPSAFTKKLTDVFDQIWFCNNWSVNPSAIPPPPERCGVCSKVAVTHFNFFTRNQVSDVTQPLSLSEFSVSPKLKVAYCETGCYLKTASTFLQQLHFLLKKFNTDLQPDKQLGRELRAEMYQAWASINYHRIRDDVQLLFRTKHLVFEKGKLTRMSESVNEEIENMYKKLLQRSEIEDYVNKLLIHEKTFPCNHRLVWKGMVDMTGLEKSELPCELQVLHCNNECRLYTCPSVDMIMSEKSFDLQMKEAFPWSYLGKHLPTAKAFALEVGSISCKFLREHCWKLYFSGDLAPLQTSYGVYFSCAVIIFTSRLGLTFLTGIVLMKNQEGRWVAFIPHKPEELRSELVKGDESRLMAKVFEQFMMKYMRNLAVQEDDQMSPMRLLHTLHYDTNQKLLSLAGSVDRSLQNNYNVVHKKNNKRRVLEQPEALCLCNTSAPHLVGCPHTLLWRGSITVLGLTYDSVVRRFSVSGWAFECQELMRRLLGRPEFRSVL